MKLLLVEDDPLLGDGLRASLGKAGFIVSWVRDGKTALGLLETEEFTIMVLDIGLPVMSGMEVLREVRARGDTLPILMLTARDTTRDKVLSLDRGADDYLVKTADMEELIARLRSQTGTRQPRSNIIVSVYTNKGILLLIGFSKSL